jgi:hypothetical protein
MIRKLPESRGDLLAYEAAGKLSEEENQQVLDELRDAIARHGKVRLFVRLPEMARPELASLDDRLRFWKDHRRDLEKYAVVADSRALGVLVKLGALLTRIDVRHFEPEEEAEAWAWLRS